MGGRDLGEGGKISPDLRDRFSATVEERGTQWVNTTEHFLCKILMSRHPFSFLSKYAISCGSSTPTDSSDDSLIRLQGSCLNPSCLKSGAAR